MSSGVFLSFSVVLKKHKWKALNLFCGCSEPQKEDYPEYAQWVQFHSETHTKRRQNASKKDFTESWWPGPSFVNATNKDPRNQAPHTEYRFMFIVNIFFG